MASLQQVEEFQRLSTEYVRQNYQRIQQVITRQRENEAQTIEQTDSFCPLAELSDRTLRAEDIQRALQEGYGDANILKSLMCMNNAIVALPQSAGISRNYKIRQYLRDLQQIGGESVEGYAMTADVEGTVQDGDDLFVVKSPRNISPELRANQIHEYFVGAFGTNTLRNRVPNFVYTLGFFQCSPPYIDNRAYITEQPVTSPRDRPALTYCQNDLPGNQVNYLLIENVANGKTFRDFIVEGASFTDFLNVFTQIVLALDLAYQTIGFTHYDLHTQNVLVRELPEEIDIPYTVDENDTVQYIRTRYVATIIDFGRSHIKYEGNDYGYALIEGGIYPDRSYPMYDIYKLLMFALADAAFGERNMYRFQNLSDTQLAEQNLLTNPDVFQNGKEMIAYFVPDINRDQVTQNLIDAAEYLIDTRKFFYTLPYYGAYNIRPLNFFENVIQAAYPGYLRQIMSSTASTGRLYGCDYTGTCKTLQQALTDYSQLDTVYIDDPYTFYEIVRESQLVNMDTILDEGHARFTQYMERLRLDRTPTINQLQQLLQGASIVSLSSGAPDPIRFDQNFLDQYRRFVAKTVKSVDLFTDIQSNELVVRQLNELYPNQAQQLVPGQSYSYNQIPEVEFQSAAEVIPFLNSAILSIKEDVNYVNSINPQSVLQDNSEAIWLFQKLPSLAAAITPI